jgi:hypothetical protein
MNEISSLELSISAVPQADARAWGKISQFALTIPIKELQESNANSLHDKSQDLDHLNLVQLRAALYFTQRIINNQSGTPDSFEIQQILKTILLIRQKLQNSPPSPT